MLGVWPVLVSVLSTGCVLGARSVSCARCVLSAGCVLSARSVVCAGCVLCARSVASVGECVVC